MIWCNKNRSFYQCVILDRRDREVNIRWKFHFAGIFANNFEENNWLYSRFLNNTRIRRDEIQWHSDMRKRLQGSVLLIYNIGRPMFPININKAINSSLSWRWKFTNVTEMCECNHLIPVGYNITKIILRNSAKRDCFLPDEFQTSYIWILALTSERNILTNFLCYSPVCCVLKVIFIFCVLKVIFIFCVLKVNFTPPLPPSIPSPRPGTGCAPSCYDRISDWPLHHV